MSDFKAPARATAEWWADKVFGPAVALTTTYDDPGGGVTLALQTMLKDSTPVPTDKRGEYVEAVTKLIATHLEWQAEKGRSPWYSVLTDYGSPYEFRAIDQRLGISSARYPSKSMSHTYADHVTAAFGYGAGSQLIWHEEGWEHPPCHQGQWDLSKPDGGRLPFKCSAPKYHALEEHVFDIDDPLCMAPDDYGRRETCNRPADDHHHAENPEAYMAKWSHPFQPERQETKA